MAAGEQKVLAQGKEDSMIDWTIALSVAAGILIAYAAAFVAVILFHMVTFGRFL